MKLWEEKMAIEYNGGGYWYESMTWIQIVSKYHVSYNYCLEEEFLFPEIIII